MVQPDGRWLAEVRAMRLKPGSDRPTLAGITVDELDELLGSDADLFFANLGCLGFDTREMLVGDTSRTRGNLAILTEPKNVLAMASLFALTRVMAIMFDRGAVE